MSEIKDETTLATILGIDNMPEEQKIAFLDKVGSVIIGGSIGRLVTNLEPDQVTKLENYLATVSSDDDIFAYLLRTYPDFQSIVEKEVASMQSEIKDLFVN